MTEEERAWEQPRAEILKRQSLEPSLQDRRAVRRLSDRLVEAMEKPPCDEAA